jgi:Domain of unknown function (DUF4280)
MSAVLTAGSTLRCTFGTVPSEFVCLPLGAEASEMPVATILDVVPMENILPFVMCMSPANPEVIAALGAPMPCVPVILDPWAPPAASLFVAGMPAATKNSICVCTWGGVISVVESPGVMMTTT